jgi:hypothetical protein
MQIHGGDSRLNKPSFLNQKNYQMITKHIIQLIMVLCLGAFALPGYGQNYITDTDVIVYSQSQIASPILVVDTDGGKVGINTTNPTQALEVVGKVLIRDADENIDPDAISSRNYNLWVTDGIVGEDLFIVNRTNWADYVFATDYELRDLAEVKRFITEHQHLPNIPSAATIQEEGYAQHDINTRFLEKIEELVLYTIEQEELMNIQAELIEQQNEQIAALQVLLNQLSETAKNEK